MQVYPQRREELYENEANVALNKRDETLFVISRIRLLIRAQAAHSATIDAGHRAGSEQGQSVHTTFLLTIVRHRSQTSCEAVVQRRENGARARVRVRNILKVTNRYTPFVRRGQMTGIAAGYRTMHTRGAVRAPNTTKKNKRQQHLEAGPSRTS